MRKLILATALLSLATPSEACWRCRCRQTPSRIAYAARGEAPAVPVVPSYVPTPNVAPAPSWGVSVPSYSDALAVLNEARALRGLGPLGWDASLAAWAASNTGVHGVMAPRASQVQAWCGDPVTAARQWLASPAHLSLILSATTSVGIGQSAGGFTANLR